MSSSRPNHILPSAMGDVRDGTVILDMYVQAVLHKVLGHHLARLDHAVLLGQFSLRK